MIFTGQTYSVLIVSSTQKLNDALSSMLPRSDYDPVCSVSNIAAARRELLAKTFDFVIINTPLPDDFGVRFAMDACENAGTVVLLLVRADAYAETQAKASAYGVFTLSKPTPVQTLHLCLKWMVSARERLRRLEKKNATVEERMEEIRLVNRAKWILIEQLRMTEAEAHRHIEKQAMDRCVSRRDIALGIIKTYS